MSRSNHDGCGKSCGVCRPHKKWKTNSVKTEKPSVVKKTPTKDEYGFDDDNEIDPLFNIGAEQWDKEFK